jgi:hypothetical protein
LGSAVLAGIVALFFMFFTAVPFFFLKHVFIQVASVVFFETVAGFRAGIRIFSISSLRDHV